MNRTPRALFSVWAKNAMHGQLATKLHEAGWEIIASGGTKKFLSEAPYNLPVIDTADISGLKPCLDHRVATLAPAIHAGLLADEVKHLEEMEKLEWKYIDLVVVDFYPLQQKLADLTASIAEINESVDVGGPTMVNSACKGGRAVVVDLRSAAHLLRLFSQTPKIFIEDKRWLAAYARAWVSEYQAAAARLGVLTLKP